MIRQLFLEHPDSVDETYFEHPAVAGSFAFALLGAGLAALVHAILRFAFEKTASRTITRLHDRMANRGR